ncbi:hypothetical protein [Reichenbachiella ulvae]|uniref:MG2 domain-containing protein n=1 Tax=Reichenbachiella ulvae TaxID=2980104 RepID=A0ABT3CXG4_9BACT|nr:hypothetical protein [Reichenbachiella ulvae]MCV9388297.1 hypothetical protein [Reichenbachiella ulvae]
MKKYKLILTAILLAHCVFIQAQDLSVLTNKNTYITKEQVLFDIVKIGNSSESEGFLTTIDLVAPNGSIIETQSLIKTSKDQLFFYLTDSLKTGIYRLIAHSPGSHQVEKRIHVFGDKTTNIEDRQPIKLEYFLDASEFVNGVESKISFRSLDELGSGISTTLSIVDDQDSVIQFLQTDANGIVSTTITPNSNFYRVNYEGRSIVLPISNRDVFQSSLQIITDSLHYKIENTQKVVSIEWNGTNMLSDKLSSENSSILMGQLKLEPGINSIIISDSSGYFLKRIIAHKAELSSDSIWKSKKQIASVYLEEDKDYYQFDAFEYYFLDQYGLDIQLVTNRDFESYLRVFKDQLTSIENQERIKLINEGGLISLKDEKSFGRVSMLTVPHLEPIEMLRSDITGLHQFEKWMPEEETRVFPYLLAGNLIPLREVPVYERANYKYSPLKQILSVDEKTQEYLSSLKDLQSINKSYREDEEELLIPEADFTYSMEDFQIPETMEDLINNIVKYLSVQYENNEPQFSLYRYMTIYKFDAPPIIFINDEPTYDCKYVLNMDPKGVERVELRNSIHSTATLGNLGLKGAVSIYLKDGIENPLEKQNADLPVLRKRVDPTQKMSKNPHSPDFRKQLFWGCISDIEEIDMNKIKSDLKGEYQIDLIECKTKIPTTTSKTYQVH